MAGHKRRDAKYPPNWRENVVIMERLDIGGKLWAQRHSDWECLKLINRHMTTKFPDGQHVTVNHDTMLEDRKLIAQMRRESLDVGAESLIAEFEHAIQEAWKAFHNTAATSMNRSGYINAIGRLLEQKGKLLGLYVDKVEISQRSAQEVEELLAGAIPDEDARSELALRVIKGSAA